MCAVYIFILIFIQIIMLNYRVTGPWGDKLNQLQTCQAWKDLHDISAEEGLVAIGYERKHEKWRYIFY